VGLWKRLTNRPASAAPAVVCVDRCQLCSAEICGTPACALVTDATAVADADTALSGRRLVTACSGEHLTALLTA
jgi:hypothetical protein